MTDAIVTELFSVRLQLLSLSKQKNTKTKVKPTYSVTCMYLCSRHVGF